MRCPYGHQLGPGEVTVGWMPCECPAALAATKGHTTWTCRACSEDGWTTRRYDPPHPRTSADLATELTVIAESRRHAEVAAREAAERGDPTAATAAAELARLTRTAVLWDAVRHRLASEERARTPAWAARWWE